ncbi:MAG TPA: hypothetical protein VJ846_04465 [Sphingomicrobium sp.]|nr:hypothetical protein [Sphingomicrobium sp.]
MTSMEPWQSPRETAAKLVRLFVPGASEESVALRARILLAAEKAEGKECISWEATSLSKDAAAIARKWWRKPQATVADLRDIIKHLTLLGLVANDLERKEDPDAS